MNTHHFAGDRRIQLTARQALTITHREEKFPARPAKKHLGTVRIVDLPVKVAGTLEVRRALVKIREL
jgi:hypothetical protein